jgi:hypothetical protein
MRLTFAALSLALLLIPSSVSLASAEDVRCSAIRDSAMCVAEPKCWYDAVNNKGCLDGPAPDQDGCTAHGSESICNASTLNCAWDPASGSCASKTN